MSTKEGNCNCKRESNEACSSTDKRKKMKANKSTAPKDIADTPRLKRRTLPLLENNRSKENILCNTKKSLGHGRGEVYNKKSSDYRNANRPHRNPEEVAPSETHSAV
ncbi:15158_t:CDS:2, partial [Dentiscutata heterogama]